MRFSSSSICSLCWTILLSQNDLSFCLSWIRAAFITWQKETNCVHTSDTEQGACASIKKKFKSPFMHMILSSHYLTYTDGLTVKFFSLSFFPPLPLSFLWFFLLSFSDPSLLFHFPVISSLLLLPLPFTSLHISYFVLSCPFISFPFCFITSFSSSHLSIFSSP